MSREADALRQRVEDATAENRGKNRHFHSPAVFATIFSYFQKQQRFPLGHALSSAGARFNVRETTAINANAKKRDRKGFTRAREIRKATAPVSVSSIGSAYSVTAVRRKVFIDATSAPRSLPPFLSRPPCLFACLSSCPALLPLPDKTRASPTSSIRKSGSRKTRFWF